MFGFFKKTEPQIVKKEEEHKRNFSTDYTNKPYAQIAREARNKTFQRSAFDDVDADFAMDGNSVANKEVVSMNFGGMPASMLSWYGSQGFIGYQACATIAQHWLVSKACLTPAKDAIRKGYQVTLNDGSELPAEIVDKVAQINKDMKLDKNIVEFVKFNKIFGIRIAMFKVESTDSDYYSKPFNIDGVTDGSYKGIAQIDPYWIAPQLDQAAASDPTAIDFYEPTYWQIGSKKIHKSHLIIIRGDEVADILKPTYLYGGIPLTQKIYERVYASERTANEAPQLALTKRTKILKTDLEEAVANQVNLETVLSGSAQLADNYGVRVIGKDDEMTQLDTTLGDLDTVIMTQYQLVAAVANVPATKLLGTSPKGFGASGEYEEANYREELESIQMNEMMPLLDRHFMLLNKSEFKGKYNFSILFNPLDSVGELEQAQINNTKAQTAQVYANIGAIDGMDVRESLAADPKSGFALELEDDQTNEE